LHAAALHLAPAAGLAAQFHGAPHCLQEGPCVHAREEKAGLPVRDGVG